MNRKSFSNDYLHTLLQNYNAATGLILDSVTCKQSRALSISRASSPRRVAPADQRMSAAIGKIRKFIRSYITIILLTGALFHAHLSLRPRVLFTHGDTVVLLLDIAYYFNKQKPVHVRRIVLQRGCDFIVLHNLFVTTSIIIDRGFSRYKAHDNK